MIKLFHHLKQNKLDLLHLSVIQVRLRVDKTLYRIRKKFTQSLPMRNPIFY